MEQLKKLLENKQYKKEVKKSNWWTEIGKEMSAYFGTNCYWIAYTFERHKVVMMFERAKKLGWKFPYFIGVLKKEK